MKDVEKYIRAIVKEQFDTGGEEIVDEDMENVESTFNYIREKLSVQDYTMAKRFVDNLKTQIDAMQRKAYGLEKQGEE